MGPASAAIARLRIDPDDRAGVFALRGVTVNGRPLAHPLAAISAANGLVRPMGEDGLLLYAVDDDPWVEFDHEAAGWGAQGSEPVDITFDVLSRGLPELLWSLVEQEALGKAALASLAERLGAATSAIHDLERRLEASQADSRAVEASTQQRLGALEARLAALHTGLSRLDALTADTAEMLGWMRRRTLRFWWHRLRGKTPGPRA